MHEDFTADIHVSPKHNIVLDDPKGVFWPGAIVGASEARPILRRGGATMPCNPELFRRNAVAGFFSRAWGGGWPLDPTTPRHMCPMLLYTDPLYTSVHWRVRLVPVIDAATKEQPASRGPTSGFLRCVSDSGQAAASAGGVSSSQIDLSELPALDAEGGWTLGGCVSLHSTGEGYQGLAIYGVGRGVRVAWAAVSQG